MVSTHSRIRAMFGTLQMDQPGHNPHRILALEVSVILLLIQVQCYGFLVGIMENQTYLGIPQMVLLGQV